MNVRFVASFCEFLASLAKTEEMIDKIKIL